MSFLLSNASCFRNKDANFYRLGTFYNAIPGQNRKDLVEEWAKDLYPEAWKELEELGRTEHEEGHLLFNMAREFKA